MATSFIDIDDQKFLGRQLVRAMSQLREGSQNLSQALAVFATMVDGNGTAVEHFTHTELVDPVTPSKGIYPTTAHAKASWDEVQSLNFVVGQAMAAINQACAKHGV